MLSVIVPVYNVEKFLSRCLDSIVHQTYKDLEILIINDASPDDSQKIINQYAQKDPRIKVFIHEKNKGLGGARNTGLDQAKGKYIAFVDSDDFLDLTAYEKLIPILEKESLDVLSFGFWSYQNEKNIEKMPILPFFLENEKIFDAYLEGKIYPAVWNRICKRSLFEEEEKIRFYENIYYEDLELSFRLMEKVKKMKQIEACFYYYYQNPISITRKKITEKNITDYAFVFEKMDEFLIKKNLEIKKEQTASLKKLHLNDVLYCILLEEGKVFDFFFKTHGNLVIELLLRLKKIEKTYINYLSNPSFFVKIGWVYLRTIFFLQENGLKKTISKIINRFFKR